MSNPLRELPAYDTIQAVDQLKWRYHTLKDDYEEAMEYREPELGELTQEFHFNRRDQIYEAEKLLHHYLAGYYTYWRQVMTVANATGDKECMGRIENERNEHDKRPSARITRGLRMYVQKENVLPLLVYQSDHDDTTPKYALNKNDIRREGLYEPSYDHYFGSVDETCIFPYEVIEENWKAVTSLHESVTELIQTHMEEELNEYKKRIQALDDVSEDLEFTSFLEKFLSSSDPLGRDLIDE